MKKYISSILFLIFSFTLLLFIPQNDKALAYGECSQYGFMVTYDYLSNSCKCMSGYVWGNDIFGNSICVSGYSACRDKYGYGAEYDSYSNSCKCSSGYIWGTDILGHKTCVSYDSYCKDKYGIMAKYNILYDKCECSYGYEFSTDIFGNKTCVGGLGLCQKKHGIHVDYNSYNHTCECDDDYTFDEHNQCVEKQHNVYFKLKELDTYNKTAIIKSEYDFKYYLITYGYGCYSNSFKRYINDQIVVNLGTDYYVDKYDYIVLQNDDETCDIKSVEKVTITYTLDEEVDVSYPSSSSTTISPELAEALVKYYAEQNNNQCGINSHSTINSKCLCDTGYQWVSDDPNDLDCVKITYTCGTKEYLGTDNLCYCNTGYTWSGKYSKCVTYNSKCREQYGQYSIYKNTSCGCKDGYELNDNTNKCEEKRTSANTTIVKPTVSTGINEDLSKLYSYYNTRKQIGCLNRDERDARCFWKKVNLIYAKEMLGKTDINDEMTEYDIEWIGKKIGFLETRYENFCANSETTGFCPALKKLIERGNYFLNK